MEDILPQLFLTVMFFAGIFLWLISFIQRRSHPRNSKVFFWGGLIYNIVLSALVIKEHNSKVEFVKARSDQRAASEVASIKEAELHRFLLADVPKEVVKPCLDQNGQIADRDESWEYSDAISDPELPRSRMVLACKYPDGTWYIQCEKGGFALQRLQFRITKDGNNHWQVSQLSGDLKEFCPTGSDND